ncbi:MAG: PD-(D/E)XK nuclease family protein [bacterium]
MNVAKKLLSLFKSAGTLTAGKINVYLSCPMKYKYQYLSGKRPWPASSYGSFTSSVLDAIEEIHNGDISEMAEGRLFEILKDRWLRRGYKSSEEERSFWTLGLSALINYVDKNRFYKNRVLAVGEKASGSFAGYRFFTRFSQISRNPSGKIEVVQFKTGKRFQDEAALKNDIQSVVNYSIAKETLGGKFASYSVYNLYHGEKIRVEPTKKNIADCEEIVRAAVRKIKLGNFEPEQGPLCSWCEFAPVCPARCDLPDPRVYKRVIESKRLALSYSKFSLYKNCPRNYKRIYIEKIASRPRYFFSIGLTIHKTMEDLYTYDGFGEPSLRYLLARYKKNWMAQGYDSAGQERKFFDDGKKWLKDYYRKFVSRGKWKKAWKVEPYFEVPLKGPHIGAGHLVVGFIDRIEQNPDGTFTIYDYKTDPILRTQEEVDGDLQLTMYFWVCEKFWNIKIKEVALIFFRFNEIVRTTRSQKDIDEMLGLLDITGEKILKNTWSIGGLAKEDADAVFPPKINKYCGGCDFLDECPLKDEILKMDRNKVMNISDDLKVNDGELGSDLVGAG